jgi:hypothetical protein
MHPKTLTCFAWHPTRDEILAADTDSIHQWNAVTGDFPPSFKQAGVCAIEWMLDGNHFVCGTNNGRVIVYVA